MHCTRCRRGLAGGSKVLGEGRHLTWRCPQRHGCFSTFSSFMIETGFAASAAHQGEGPRAVDLADALVAIERERERTLREEVRARCGDGGAGIDLASSASSTVLI